MGSISVFSLETSRMGGEIGTASEQSAKAGLCMHEHTLAQGRIILLCNDF